MPSKKPDRRWIRLAVWRHNGAIGSVSMALGSLVGMQGMLTCGDRERAAILKARLALSELIDVLIGRNYRNTEAFKAGKKENKDV
jgi:hypothetical protein